MNPALPVGWAQDNARFGVPPRYLRAEAARLHDPTLSALPWALLAAAAEPRCGGWV